MSKSFYKYKLLLDEHLSRRREYPTINERFDVKHIKDDLHHGGMDDNLIYELAIEQRRIILTSNIKDFRPLLSQESPGIIGIPESWSADRLDSKLTALLMKHGPNYFRGRLIPLGAETTKSI